MSKNSNDYTLCQPSSGYYFSRGLVVSETIYTSTSHGAFYNAASRVIVDGGRKIIQTAALGGMLAQNFTIPAYAGDSSGVVVSATTSTVSAGETWSSTNLFSGILNVYGTTIETNVLSIGSEKILYGGIASGTTVWNGGCQAVSNGGTANSTTINSGGMQSVFGGGSALGTVQLSGGNVNVDVYGGDTSTVVSGTNESGTFRLSNGVASGFILYSGGVQIVDEGGVAINTIIVSSGTMTIASGASANDVTVLDSGVISVMLGGQVSGLTQQEYGLINFTVAGGDEATYISGTNQNSSGMLLESGVASGFVLNRGATMTLSSGGIATDITQNEDGIINLRVSGGDNTTYISGTNQNSSGMLLESGVASGFVINSGAIVYIYNGGSAVETVINPIGRLNVRNGTAENTIVDGRMNVSDEGLALNTTINAAGFQVISAGGVASATEIYGTQRVQMYGSAVNYTVKSGGRQLLEGSSAYSKDFTVESGGYVSGVHQVSNGKISFNVIGGDETTYISGTNQNGSGMLLESGVASGFVINSGAIVNIDNGGSAVETVINAGLLNVRNGTAEDTIVNGRMNVSDGGLALSTTINADGMQVISEGGVASDTEIYGMQVVQMDGSAVNYTVKSGGSQLLDGSRAYSKDFTVESGGYVRGVHQVSNGKISFNVIGGDEATYISGTNQLGSGMLLESGVASGFVINSDADVNIDNGGSAVETVINVAGFLGVRNGTAENTIVNSNGIMYMESAGSAISTMILSGGKQVIEGIASNTVIENSGTQDVVFGGVASNTDIQSGGTMSIGYRGSAMAFTVRDGGIARMTSTAYSVGDFTVESGGYVSGAVQSSGAAINFSVIGGDENTCIIGKNQNGGDMLLSSGVASGFVINSGATMNVSSGGIASNTDIQSGGAMSVNSGGIAREFTVRTGGSATMASTALSVGDFTVESGGYVSGAVQSSGAAINFSIIGGDENTYIAGTNQLGSGMLLESGVASGFVLNSGVNVDVNSNGSAVATIVNAEGRLYVSNGTAENTIVNSNGRMYVESAGSAISTTIQSGGKQVIEGIASNTVIENSGTQDVVFGGVASNTDIQSNGMQVVRSGAIATATTIDDGGYMTIDSGGQATGIVQSAGAKIDVRVIGGDNATIVSGTNENGEFRLQSGIASNFVINNGIQSVFGSGAMAIGTTLNSTRQSLYAGTQAIGTIANYGAGQVVNPNALATSTTLINSAWQDIYESAIASDTLVGNSAMQLVHSGALATSTTIQDAGLQYVFGGGTASNTVVGNSGTQDIIGGYAEDTTIQNGGLQKVSSASLASNTEIQSGGSMHVSSGGSATAFTVRDGGMAEMDSTAESVGDFTVESGGYVSGAVQSSGAAITFNAIGGDENTYIAGTNQLGSGMLLESGVASGFVLNNGANIDVNSNGSTVATIINSSGRMNVINGTAENTTINENGSMFVQNAGYALSGVINNAGQQTVFGLAQYISVNSGGHQTISAGGADFGVVSEGGIQIVVGGSASQTQVYGEQRLSAGTDHNAVIHSNAVQNITGGTAYMTTISGNQNISSGGAAESATIQSGGSQTVRDGGIATSTTIEDGGAMAISQGGQATGIVQSAGAKIDVMIIGGDSTTLVSGTNENGEFRLQSGIASNFVVNSGASQAVHSGASAIETTVNGGAYQAVYAGGSAIGATVNNGSQYLNVGASATGTILNEGANQHISENAVANETILESGATQHITSDGLAISTTIRNGGLQNVYDGGIASSTDIQSGGTQRVYSGGSALMYTISSGGIQIIDEGGYASGYIVEGDQVISSGGSINNVDIVSGGSLDIQSGGNVSNVNIVPGGMVNVSGNVSISEDTILNGGNIVISRVAEDTPAVFTMDNLSGTGGIFDMTVPLDNPAETDKINVNSSHDGDAVIRISYTGNEDPVGEGIQLVHYADPANANGTFFLDSGSVLDTGWYEHSLARGGFAPGTEKDYYLRATSNLTPIAKAVSDTPQIAEAAVTVALNSLQKRLGDLRNMQNGDATQGVWARGYYKSMTVKGENETDMDVSGLEAGYDWRIGGSPVNYSGEGFYLGLMAGAADISGIKNETGKTTGKGSSFLGGLYGTYIAENGWFTDFTARAGNNELDITVKGAETLKMKPERMFWSVSAEAGKQFSLGSKGRFTLEPKAEVQYTNVGSDTVYVENSGGKKAKFDGSDTLNAIGTINATYRMTRANGLEIAPYAEVAWTQTITGEESVTYNNHKEKTDMTGGVFEGRLGLNMQLSKNVYWHIAGSYETGKKLESYGADAGIRFMFGGKGKSEAKPVAQPKIAIDQAKPFTLGSTTFKTGATNLTANAKENLDGLVEYLNANPKTRITVAGHTDSTGSVERNNVISGQRAIAVKDYLTEQGISADRIKTVGYGSTKPAATNATAEGREKNRRIEITFDK